MAPPQPWPLSAPLVARLVWLASSSALGAPLAPRLTWPASAALGASGRPARLARLQFRSRLRLERGSAGSPQPIRRRPGPSSRGSPRFSLLSPLGAWRAWLGSSNPELSEPSSRGSARLARSFAAQSVARLARLGGFLSRERLAHVAHLGKLETQERLSVTRMLAC